MQPFLSNRRFCHWCHTLFLFENKQKYKCILWWGCCRCPLSSLNGGTILSLPPPSCSGLEDQNRRITLVATLATPSAVILFRDGTAQRRAEEDKQTFIGGHGSESRVTVEKQEQIRISQYSVCGSLDLSGGNKWHKRKGGTKVFQERVGKYYFLFKESATEWFHICRVDTSVMLEEILLTKFACSFK